jgi:hypothetical protein
MKGSKTIFFSILMAFLTQFAVGQSHDPYSADRTEPGRGVKLFPNPATDYLSVKFESPQAKTVKITLHNIIGNSLEVESEILDEYEIRLKVKDLPAGYYLLAVKEQDNTQSAFKFLKR